jgi:TP901-1 family phage major tail protein
MPTVYEKGYDLVISVEGETPGTYIVVAGQRGVTLTEESDTVEFTDKTSSGAKVFDYGLYSWSVSADGVHVTGDTAYDKLADAIRNKTKVKVSLTSGAGTAKKYQGTGIVTSREFEGAYDGEATYSVEIQGTGALTLV